MTTKFYAYAGRWRELCLETGRVSGWSERARFVYLKRGKLVLASRRRVLHALREHAAGRPSAIHEGPRLPRRRRVTEQHRWGEEEESFPEWCLRAKLLRRSKERNEAALTLRNREATRATRTADAAVQVVHEPRSEPQLPEIVFTRRKRPGADVDAHKCRTEFGPDRIRSPGPAGSTEDAPPQRNAEAIIACDRVAKRKRSCSVDTADRPKRLRDDTSERGRPAAERKARLDSERETRRAPSSSSDDFVLKPPSRPVNVKNSDQRLKSTASSMTGTKSKRQTTNRYEETETDNRNCKELIIDLEDVTIFRSYLKKNCPDVDLARFDLDDDYKRVLLVKINPLVTLRRCPQIRKLLRHGATSTLTLRETSPARDDITLKQFASTLGLRSISDDSGVRKYRTRRSNVPIYVVSDTSDPDKENDSEGGRRLKNLNKPHLKISKTVMSKNNGPYVAKCSEPSLNSRVSDVGKNTAPGRGTGRVDSIVSKGKAREGREYSNLEDHAIVSWVSASEGRARQVNGNQLWRQLQLQYHRLTGRERPWQSLRNRYLRYLLPALGALCLPPHHAARLRAAASRGMTKGEKRPFRRNSIFGGAPPLSAFSRRPPPHSDPPSDTGSVTEEPQRAEIPAKRALRSRGGGDEGGPSPRYSLVTRQFEARARPSRSPPAPAPSPGPSEGRGRRTRKLFNPNAPL